ncbi:hypothetical protein BRADI_3g27926v3 [Brachypodium distachyon]|uniref:Uncharacterized protein n=1 Tax=Brachypodium distachyon TaxID=15368 RepID=A0A2K2CZN4_BRADI|nr:hypothetical protein BRADI_3g27926v3 [Brachypodium distachyon]
MKKSDNPNIPLPSLQTFTSEISNIFHATSAKAETAAARVHQCIRSAAMVQLLFSGEDIFSRRFQIISPLLRVPPSPCTFTPLLNFLPPLLSQPQAPNVESFTLLTAIAHLALPPAASLLHCYKIHCVSTPTPLIQPRSHGRSPQIHPHYLPPPPPAARGNGLLPSPPQRLSPGTRRRRRRLPQQGGDVATADAGVRRRVHDRQPNRRLLALRGHGLAPGPAAAGRLRHRVWPQRAGRQRGALVRGDRLLGPRPREPVPWHAPPRRDPGRAPVDRLRRRHDHPAQRGAPGQLLQDHRRSWRQRPRRGGRRLHHAAVRVQRHHPQHPRARLRAGGERQRPVVADAQRVADPVGRRRHLALLGPGRVGRPLRAVPVRGRAGGRHHGIHGHHRLQLLLLAPQRGDVAGPQRRLPAGLRDAGHHRIQPLRGPARAADAPMPPRLLPHRQQRLHRLGDVRHRRQRQPHHQLPGQPLHRPRQPQRQGGDEAGGHGGRAVERVELADGGGHDGERRLLRALG